MSDSSTSHMETPEINHERSQEWQGSYHVGFHLLGSDAHHQSKQVVTFGALQCGNQLKHGSQMRIQTCI